MAFFCTALAVSGSAQQSKPSAFVSADVKQPGLVLPVRPPALAGTLQDSPAKTVRPRFTFIGVKRAQDCGPALPALLKELESLEYPADWTFKIACSPLLWEMVQRKTDRTDAPYAVSQLRLKLTLFNSAVFREDRSVYRRAISHELGHIRCDCADEDAAEKWAKRLEKEQAATLQHGGPQPKVVLAR